MRLATRMKELRYMRKTTWKTYAELEEGALDEVKEDHDFPDRLPIFDGNAETGLANGVGWRLQAFIEDRDGELRPQTFEETVFCVGCHGGIGATDDSTFAFPRKLAAPTRRLVPLERARACRRARPGRHRRPRRIYPLSRENGAGDEFRANREIIGAFFDADGKPNAEALTKLRHDVATLLYPSRRRGARPRQGVPTIVEDQDYVRGRAALLAPADNVHREVEQDQPTGIEEALTR